jgi:Sortase domain
VRRALAWTGTTLLVLAAVVGLVGGRPDHGAPPVSARPKRPAQPTAAGSGGAPTTRPVRDSTPADAASAVTRKPSNRPGLPQRIIIPALGVRAPVEPIRADDGVLTPPDDPTEAGWWSAGARPGAARGSAIVTGHTVSTGGGVFDDLEQLHPGDLVTVASNGDRLRFVVNDVTAYRKRSLADHARRVFSQAVAGRLVLVTCEDWNGTVYLSNEVVTAVPQGS